MTTTESEKSAPRRVGLGSPLAKVAAVVVLIVATLGLARCDGRYRLDQAGILRNPGFTDGLRYWSATGGDITPAAARGAPLWLSIDAARGARPRPIAIVSQYIAEPSRFEALRVAAEIGAEDLRPGAEPWQRAGIIVYSYDQRGQRLRYWPYEVALLSAATDWRRVEAVIPIAAEAVAMRLFVYNAATTGRLAVRNLAVDAVREAPWSGAVLKLLMGVWIVVVAWIAVPLFVARSTRPTGRAAIIVGALILVAVMTPQPDLSDAVRAVETRIGAFLTPTPTRAPSANETAASGDETGAPTETSAQTSAQASTKTPASAPAAGGGVFAPLRAGLPGLGPERTDHFLALTLFAALAGWGWRGVPWPRRALYLATTAAAFEVVQSFVVTRTTQIGDAEANLAGVALGLALALAIEGYRRQRTTEA